MVGKKSDTERDMNTYRRMVGRRGLLGGGPRGEVEHFIFFLLESENEGSFLVGDSLLRTSRQGSSSMFRGPKRGDKFRPRETTFIA